MYVEAAKHKEKLYVKDVKRREMNVQINDIMKGGNIIAQGKPEDIVKVKDSYTGQFLKNLLINKTKKIA